MTVLAGDIGGTKTLLQLAQVTNDGLQVRFEQRYLSADYPTFLPLIQDFMQRAWQATGLKPQRACLGVAGPVAGRQVTTTNLPWHLHADELEQALGIVHMVFINDFAAVGYGIAGLRERDLVSLQAGTPRPHGTCLVIGAGTGLGQGLLVWQHDHYQVVPSEGGHTDFAPRDALQRELAGYLQQRYQWATWERAVSGPGLVNIYQFLLARAGNPAQSAALLQTEDPAAEISQLALQGSDALAGQALDLFIQLYGAQAGNLALVGLATGGVYIAGGVAPKIIDRLQQGDFMRCFLDKEARMQPLLQAMPVQVVMNPHVGLLGSALVAARLPVA